MGCRCWLDASSVPLQIILPPLLLLCVASRPSLSPLLLRIVPTFTAVATLGAVEAAFSAYLLRLLLLALACAAYVLLLALLNSSYLLCLLALQQTLQPADVLCSSEKQLCCSKYSSQASAAAQNILSLLLLLLLKIFVCCCCCSKYSSPASAAAQNIHSSPVVNVCFLRTLIQSLNPNICFKLGLLDIKYLNVERLNTRYIVGAML